MSAYSGVHTIQGEKAIWLQNVGYVAAKPIEQFRKGDIVAYNDAGTGIFISKKEASPKFWEITVKEEDNGKIYHYKVKKGTLKPYYKPRKKPAPKAPPAKTISPAKEEYLRKRDRIDAEQFEKWGIGTPPTPRLPPIPTPKTKKAKPKQKASPSKRKAVKKTPAKPPKPLTTAKYRNMAWDAKDRGDWKTAAKYYDLALKHYPTHHAGSQVAAEDMAKLRRLRDEMRGEAKPPTPPTGSGLQMQSSFGGGGGQTYFTGSSQKKKGKTAAKKTAKKKAKKGSGSLAMFGVMPEGQSVLPTVDEKKFKELLG